MKPIPKGTEFYCDQGHLFATLNQDVVNPGLVTPEQFDFPETQSKPKTGPIQCYCGANITKLEKFTIATIRRSWR